MSDGINDGLGGHRDWQTLWSDWNGERQRAEAYYRDLQTETTRADNAARDLAALRAAIEALAGEWDAEAEAMIGSPAALVRRLHAIRLRALLPGGNKGDS